ncbi:MAG TPA: YcxB family protein [Acidobacteriaceae bacterium]|jgi:hypothetical protein
MQFEYSVSYKDFVDSIKCYRKEAPGAALYYYVYVWVVPCLGALLALWWLVSMVRGNTETAASLRWLALMGAFLAIVLPVTYWGKIRQTYAQRTSLTEGSLVVLHADDTGVRFSVPEKVDASYAWSALTKFVETDRVGTLFINRAAFHTIPKRDIAAEDWREFRTLIHRYLEVR